MQIVPLASAKWPPPKQIIGKSVVIVPLDAQRDADDMFGQMAGHDPLWDWMPVGPFSSRAAFADYLHGLAASSDPLCFAIRDIAPPRTIGYACLMRVDLANRVIEVGNILFCPPLQRSRGATEVIFMLAQLVFETLGFRRLEWKCNTLNAPSRAAALRFGFAFEGIFKQHMIVKGKSRDTAWFAMLDHEWPARKRRFEAWLNFGNFDAQGQQKRRLEEMEHA